jgi:predicted O-linked N-acetylglucosamine transferase (SPINDLY family)
VKVSDAALAAWGEILAAVPGSRLSIHAQPGRYLADVVAKLGCAPDRVTFVPYRGFLDYYRAYDQIDILLDPFPCTGGTTTCDALWMGVPVITLAGKIAVHRGGVSLLRNLSLDDLIAPSVDHYIDAAVSLASSRQRLADLRATLRGRMLASDVMNAPQFLRDLESAYLQMWST